jgi:sulfide dehydrogenase cytochrome subunit
MENALMRLRTTLAALAALAFLGPAATAQAADAPPGARGCLGCHGSTSDDAAMPSLKGRKAADIVTAMSDYRDGKRDPSVMDRIAKGFTDAQTRTIAQWIATQ